MYAITYFTWSGSFNPKKPKYGVFEPMRLATGTLAFWDNHFGPSDCVMIIPNADDADEKWVCPIGRKDCKRNCGNYGCGN